MENEQKIASEILTMMAEFIRVRNLSAPALLHEADFYALEDEITRIIQAGNASPCRKQVKSWIEDSGG